MKTKKCMIHEGHACAEIFPWKWKFSLYYSTSWCHNIPQIFHFLSAVVFLNFILHGVGFQMKICRKRGTSCKQRPISRGIQKIHLKIKSVICYWKKKICPRNSNMPICSAYTSTKGKNNKARERENFTLKAISCSPLFVNCTWQELCLFNSTSTPHKTQTKHIR